VLGNPDDNIVEDAAGFSGSVEDDGVWGNVDNNDGGGLPAVSNRTISGNRFPYVVSIRRFGQHLCTGTIVDATTILTSAVCLQYNTFELFVSTHNLPYMTQLALSWARTVYFSVFLNFICFAWDTQVLSITKTNFRYLLFSY
jgi:hypothetical protein